jgi:predicted acetyltransferase
VDIRIESAGPEQKDAIGRLLEFNMYEFSRFFDDADVDEHGRFGYRYFEHYWLEADRHPFLIRADGRIAGMVLARTGNPHSIAEFLVLPRYRRHGVGLAAARQVFARFPGEWEVHQIPGNAAAVEFWRKAIPAPFTETRVSGGTTQRFAVGSGGRLP